MYPENLYRLAGADVESQYLNIVLRNPSASSAATQVSTQVDIPAGEVWLIEHLSVRGNSGAGQVTTRLEISIDIGATNLLRLATEDQAIVAAERNGIDRQFAGMPLKGPLSIVFTGNYDLAGVANTTVAGLVALSIPRGNFNQT